MRIAHSCVMYIIWFCTSTILFLVFCCFYKHSHLEAEPLSAAVDCRAAPLEHVSASSHLFSQRTLSIRWPLELNPQSKNLCFSYGMSVTSDCTLMFEGYRDKKMTLMQFPSMHFPTQSGLRHKKVVAHFPRDGGWGVGLIDRFGFAFQGVLWMKIWLLK